MGKGWKRGLLALALAGLAAAAVVAWPPSPPQRTQAVGRVHLGFDDPERSSSHGVARPLRATLWYPAVGAGAGELWQIGLFRFGWNTLDAALAEPGQKRPLILLSHGTGGSAAQLSWLAEALVQQGYLVAAVNHSGNTAAEEAYTPQGFALWWERARDLSVLLDRLLADPHWSAQIDAGRIGAAGFSLGGYTMLSLAGARTDLERWRSHCATQPTHAACQLPPEAGFDWDEAQRVLAADPFAQASLQRAGDPHRDPRLRAVFAMAPVLGPALVPESLQQIAIPVALRVGSEDPQARPEDNAVAFAALIPAAELQVVEGAGHYVYLAECAPLGRWRLPALCADGALDRAREHQDAAAQAGAFFARHLAAPGAVR